MAIGDYTKTTFVEGGAPGISAATLNNNEIKTEELDTELLNHETAYDTHLKDYVRQPGYGATGGTSTAYTLTLDPAPSAYADGQQFIIKPHVECGANPTLNVNSLGALTILTNDGSAIAAGDIPADKPLSLVRVGSNFFIRSGSGDDLRGAPKTSGYAASSGTMTDLVNVMGKGWLTNITATYDRLISVSIDGTYVIGSATTGANVPQYGDLIMLMRFESSLIVKSNNSGMSACYLLD